MTTKRNHSSASIACDQWLHILDELSIGAFIVDEHRRVTAINYSAQALMGLKAADVIGRDCREVFLGIPCMVDCMVPGIGDSSPQGETAEIPHGHDSRRLITRLATPVCSPDRRVIGCLTILQDHSPIADLVDRIHFEERSQKIILDNLDIGIFTVNRGGHITFFNTGAEKITGYDRRQVLGKPCSILFDGNHSEDLHILKKAIAEDGVRIIRQGKIATCDGVVIPVRARCLALKNEKDAVVGGLVTFHDLSLVVQLDQAIRERYTFHDMIGKGPEMQKIFEMVDVVAVTDATILIEGPTGTGKDLLTQIIHSASRRSEKPLVKVNCAAIPENLLESEFFGYVKGAFTGADRDKPGRFQEANGGTIFLDEIGELPLPLQAKLLRVLEDKEFYPLGSRRTSKVDVRIISACNLNMEQMVAKRLFREDLFYRLNVFRIELPPLKERRVDLPVLIRHIVHKLCAARGERPREISENTMEILLNYEYPGNVRELENILEHALIVCQDEKIKRRHLPAYLQKQNAARQLKSPPDQNMGAASGDGEREKILNTLRQYNWHRQKTASALGMERTTLWRKMKKFGLGS